MALIDRYGRSKTISDTLAHIEQARQLLESHLTKPEEWHGVIKRHIMASVVHYSTKIEGNRLTREQVEAIIAGESIEAAEKDKAEALNYHEAMQWAQIKAVDRDWRLTHESILTLHFMIGRNLGADYEPLGCYRQTQNQVIDKRTDASIYWPPRTENVMPLMNEFVESMRKRADSSMNPYIASALVHLNFVAIHPFSDGNGRVCRVLCSLLMLRHGYRSQAFYSLEEYFGSNWQEYGQQISQCLGSKWPDDPGRVDTTAWIEWYLNAILTEVTKAEQQLRRALAELGVVYLILALDGINRDRKALALWLAVREGSVTNRAYRSTVGVQSNTAGNDLGTLVGSGHLAMVGTKRNAHYVLGPEMTKWGDVEEAIDLWVTKSPDAASAHLSQSRVTAQSLFEIPN